MSSNKKLHRRREREARRKEKDVRKKRKKDERLDRKERKKKMRKKDPLTKVLNTVKLGMIVKGVKNIGNIVSPSEKVKSFKNIVKKLPSSKLSQNNY